MKLITFFSLCVIMSANANFAEFFGASPSTSAIGNQATLDITDPANNYYVPAVLAFNQDLSVGLSSSSVSPKFKDINNVQTRNSSFNSTSEVGGVNTDYGNSYHSSVNISLPIAKKNYGSLGLSFLSPLGNLLEANTGSPNEPEYVMYHSRYKRTIFHLNYAYPINDTWAISLGAHVGFQTSADTNTDASLDASTTYASSGRAKIKSNPSLSGIFSLARKTNDSLSYFTFQQEMKSNLKANANGEISDPTNFLFNISLQSMIYYDPHIFRFGYAKSFGSVSFFSSLEYQLWENYKTPTLIIVQNGGVLRGSENFEKVSTENIFIPKLGLSFALTDSMKIASGYSYRPTPIKGDFSGAGNSIDSDTHIFSLGGASKMSLFDIPFEGTLSAQYHALKSKTVTKTSGQENGSSGTKIGGPSYDIGGKVYVVSAGLNLVF